MEPITLISFLAVAIVTGATTYTITKNVYNDEHEKLKAHINNQLIINEERDKSHEFSQTIFIILLAIVTSIITLYVALKCAVNAFQNRVPRRQIAIQQAPAIAPAAAVFEA